jgi:hypothetical protein
MKVLVACEFSGVVREAFLTRGHDAYSCDILPAGYHKPNPPSRHIRGDVTALLKDKWDLVIAHPPCTYLCNSGVRWLKVDGKWDKIRWYDMVQGALFFKKCLEANAPKVCVENPIMHGYAVKIVGVLPTQRIQPWQFGHGESKCTCLWLRGLSILKPTKIAQGRKQRIHEMYSVSNRGLQRSVFYPGIAKAMAEQWG